jgi:hypothetical protein
MVYKWQAMRDKITSSKLHSIKPGSGRKPLHTEVELKIHQEAIQSRREGVSVILAGIAQSMRNTVGDPLFKASSGWIKGHKKRVTTF